MRVAKGKQDADDEEKGAGTKGKGAGKESAEDATIERFADALVKTNQKFSFLIKKQEQLLRGWVLLSFLHVISNSFRQSLFLFLI